MGERDVIIRTLDVGGDKLLGYFGALDEQNPALGLRATRFALAHPDVFSTQLRAILRAAGARRARIMFPMIGSLDELRAAKDAVAACLRDVRATATGPVADPLVGMMIELPAAAEVLDALASECDFFSIGTNDFVQYLLAADRANPRVADYYCPHHPAVLRALARIAACVARHGKDLAVCGEMAHDPRYIPFLIGIGIRRLSVDPHYLPVVQRQILRTDGAECAAFSEKLLSCTSTSETDEQIRDWPGKEP
jgi:phosphotransferase system enzyme I (PtsP)